MPPYIPRAERIEIPDDLIEAVALLHEKGWTEGLPVIPPTEERVARMLAGTNRDPQEEIGVVPPRWAPATVEKVAINAVMAGCLPEYMPVLIAAVEAVAEPKLNLYALQATTGGPAILLIVNGPIRRELNINSGPNVFGEGFKANATIGRALRLILRNIGGAYPGASCKATLGWPGKFSLCIAENEEATSWLPLHVERGFSRDESTVTAISVDSFTRIGEQGSPSAEALLYLMVQCLHRPGAPEAVMVIGPEHAQMLSRAGIDKEKLKNILWERATFTWRDIPEDLLAMRARRRPDLRIARDTVFRLVDKPEDILVVVAGGAGLHSAFLHVWGQTTPTGGSTRSVTKIIKI
ncbi:MAG TPA: hypothetical protein VNL14_23745 [Candidatus Acidoferrales bacterium]|nr:hypothetical protein [Candidatus Acidoferrales bacterium]